MNAVTQLAMFEPEPAEAVALLESYLNKARRHADLADRFHILGMRGACREHERLAAESASAAEQMAFYLDFLYESGEVGAAA